MDKFLMMLKDAAMYALTNGPKVVGGVAIGTVTYRLTDGYYDDVQLWNAERKYKKLKAKIEAKAKAGSSKKKALAAKASAPRHAAKRHEAHAPA